MRKECSASFCPGSEEGCLLKEAIASPQGEKDLVAHWNMYQHTCPRAGQLNAAFLLKLAEILDVSGKPNTSQ